MEKNKEKELINEALKAIKSGEYIKEFQMSYMESLNNVMLDSNKMKLAINVFEEIKKNKNNKKLKEIDYYPTLLSSFILTDRYYEDLKDIDKNLLVTLSYSSYYLVGTNTDDFMILFGDGELVNKLSNNKQDLLDNMSKALNFFNKRKDFKDIDGIKKYLILNSSYLDDLEHLFKFDKETKTNAINLTLDKGVKKK